MSDPVRLSKRLAAQLPCSRREAELYIEGGWVTVDGVVVEEPQHPVQEQTIALLPGASLEPVLPATLMWHKPADYKTPDAEGPVWQLLTPETHWADDPSRLRSLRRHLSRQKPMLALDDQDSGLMIFTQDWRTARKLGEDGYLLEQEFIVEIAGTLAPEQLQQLNHGLHYRGRPLPPCKVSRQSETRLRFALKAPQAGQIRFMCESVGVQVLGIKRIRVGRLPMAGLPVGQWRYIAPYERF